MPTLCLHDPYTKSGFWGHVLAVDSLCRTLELPASQDFEYYIVRKFSREFMCDLTMQQLLGGFTAENSLENFPA